MVWTSLAEAVHRRRRGRTSVVTVPAPLLELARLGPAPLVASATPADPGPDPHGPLRIATVIPPFWRASGGHATIISLMRELALRGHAVSLWLEDWGGKHARESSATTRRSFGEFFDAPDFEVHTDFRAWTGADVVLATGWQTVPRALLLTGARARAYLVQDHEPEFYGTSAETLFAQWTYRQGLYCIAASPWLADVLRTRYQASACHFDLGVDHAVYRPSGRDRRRNLVVFYARAVTPRRAVPLGLLALAELLRRRPELDIALFGGELPLRTAFRHSHLGVLGAAGLADLYSRATVGMVLSLTNPSLVGLEMMACGLPCVELATESMLATFGSGGPLELVEPDPLRLASALERIVDDPGIRDRMTREGVALMAPRTWARAAGQVELGLRAALSRTTEPTRTACPQS